LSGFPKGEILSVLPKADFQAWGIGQVTVSNFDWLPFTPLLWSPSPVLHLSHSLSRFQRVIPDMSAPRVRTCPASEPYPGLSLLDHTYSVPRPGSKDGCWTCLAPDSGFVVLLEQEFAMAKGKLKRRKQVTAVRGRGRARRGPHRRGAERSSGSGTQLAHGSEA
jgi:hypothetical protein